MEHKLLSLSAPVQNFKRLQIIRGILIGLLVSVIAVCASVLRLELPYFEILLVLSGILIVNLVSWLRLYQPRPIAEVEYFGHLMVDIFAISLLLYFSGGAGNPFISYYLVPLTISAATLPWVYTWVIACASLSCYSLLLFYHQPIPAFAPSGHESALNLHILGMWFNFALSAGIIAFFVVKMSIALRQQNEQLSLQREERLRDEQILGVAILAAGTAHELGTPLSTIKTLVSDLHKQYADDAELLADLELIRKQVSQCSKTLRDLVDQAELESANQPQYQDLRSFSNKLIEQWRLLHPEVTSEVKISSHATLAAIHPSITQALLNLLNNAAEANPIDIHVQISWDDRELEMDIKDRGTGVPDDIVNSLGSQFVSTKNGMGLGFLLSDATLSRYGGTIQLFNRPEGGTLTQVRLPIEPLEEKRG